MNAVTRVEFVPEPNEVEVIIDHLMYASYRANRNRSPEIPPPRWSAIYANVEAMEARYQSEKFKTPVAASLVAA